jgi:DNA-binding IclR family transcriptional regulator
MAASGKHKDWRAFRDIGRAADVQQYAGTLHPSRPGAMIVAVSTFRRTVSHPTVSHKPDAARQRHPDPNFATTLAHGLAVLECFVVGEPALSNKQLAERTGLSKATISRLTYTLAARGMLSFDSQLRRYRLGSTTLSLGYPLLANLAVRQTARPRMRQLADEAGGSVSLGMRDRISMVYLETVRGHHGIAFRPDIGASLPIMQSAMGRAWLAQADPALRHAILGDLRQRFPQEWERWRDAVERACEDLAQKGYCVSRGDWQTDVHAVAVPMQVPIDGEILVFNCGVPAIRASVRQFESVLGPKLLRLVRRVEADGATV